MSKLIRRHLTDEQECIVSDIPRFIRGYFGGARGVMVIVPGYEHDDTSSIPGPDWLHFT